MKRIRMTGSFWLWLVVGSVGALGASTLRLAIAWSAAELGGAAAGGISMVTTAAVVLLILLGGVMGDHYGPKQVLRSATVASLVHCALVVVMLTAGVPLLVALLVNGAIAGGLQGIRTPSTAAFARLLVPADSAARAVSIDNSALMIVGLIAPTLGGLIVATAGLTASFLIAAAVYVTVWIALGFINPLHTPTPEKDSSLRKELRAGIYEVVHHRTLRGLLASLVAISGSLLTATTLLIPLLAHQREWDAPTLGIIVSAWGVGSLIGTTAIAVHGPMARPLLPLIMGPIVACFSGISLALTSMPLGAAGSAMLLGLGTATFTGHLVPVFVHLSPVEKAARLSSLLHLAQMIPLLVAAPVLGLFADRFGASLALVVSSVISLLALAPLIRTPELHQLTLPSDGKDGGRRFRRQR